MCDLLSPWFKRANFQSNPFPDRPLVFEHVLERNTKHWRKAHKFGHPIIVPLRHPEDVARSWVKRNADMRVFDDMWGRLVRDIAPMVSCWIRVDHADREKDLARLGDLLGLELSTDWAPVGHDERMARTIPDVSRWVEFYEGVSE